MLCHPAPSHSPSHAFCECPLNCVLGVRNRADLFWVNTFWVNRCGTTSLRYDEVLHKRVTHPEAEIPEGDLGAEQGLIVRKERNGRQPVCEDTEAGRHWVPSQLREVPSGLGPLPEREAGFLLCHCLGPENSGKPGWIEEGGRPSWGGHVRQLPLVVGGERLRLGQEEPLGPVLGSG